MSYNNQLNNYAIKIGSDTYGWFKDYDAARNLFNFYATSPNELHDVLVLMDSHTGELLEICQPEK